MVKKKIAIIGGAGFVGSSLAQSLSSNNIEYKIFDIDLSKKNKEVHYLDVEKLDSLDAISDSNIIINLAAVHRDDITPITRYDDVNVEGAVNVCKAARKNMINKIIFTSSVAIYGFAPANTGEDGKPNYFNDYGRTKFLAEKVYEEWYNEDPINRTLVIIRPTVIFGKGNRGNVYNLLRQIASKKFLMIGNGKNIKSMAYVENVADFLTFSTSFGTGIHIYNYIDKPDLSMNDLVKKTRKLLFKKNNVGLIIPAFIGIFLGYIADIFIKLTKISIPVSSIRVKKFISTTQFSSSIRETGYIPLKSLDDGLEETIIYEFIENNNDKETFNTE